MTPELDDLRRIVDSGYCIGCGACAFAADVPMVLNDYGEYAPQLDRLAEDRLRYSPSETASVCPFLRPDLNETELAKERFSVDAQFDSKIGYIHAAYAGYVREGDFRAHGTSGGSGTWVGTELLRRGLIDGVIHVKPIERTGPASPLFAYGISRTPEEIRQGAKTRYHVVELSSVVSAVHENPGSYLFIGVPCICKAVRRLQRVDPILNERIRFVVSLVCGHLKSVHWTLSLAWAAGIAPEQLKSFQYRTKGPDIPARAYVFRAIPDDSNREPVQMNSADVLGGRFNAGAMMVPACDFCDDVVGETADLSIGDAWIPRFDVDSSGTNLLIVRNPEINDLLTSAVEEGRFHLDPISAEEAGGSQSGGFRQRRQGLSYRLAKAQAEGVWAPAKRVQPGEYELTRLRRRIYDARSEAARASRETFRAALEQGRYATYAEQMGPILARLRRLEVRSALFRAGWGRVKRIVLTLARRLRKG